LLAFAIAFLTIACIPSERSSCSGAERDAEQVVVARDNHGRELLLVSRQGHLMTRRLRVPSTAWLLTPVVMVCVS
jgi:hypothetical protein